MTVQVTQLPSGLRIVSESRRTVETVAIGVWVDVGARFETKTQNRRHRSSSEYGDYSP